MAERPRVVGVSLKSEQRGQLEAQAKRLGIPPSTLARRLLVSALADEPAQDVLAAITALEREVRALKAEFGTARAELSAVKKNVWNAALTLLVRQKPMTPAEANLWAKEHLSR